MMGHALRIALRQVYAVLLALDLLASALTGGAPLETLSARFWAYRTRWPVLLLQEGVDFVARAVFQEPNHCEGAYAAYLERLRVVPEYEG